MKNRTYLLKREEERLKSSGSDANKQTICVEMDLHTAFCDDDCTDRYLKSLDKIPDLIAKTTPQFTTMNVFQSNVCYIPFEKMKYTGHNKYLRNIIYAAIGPDKYVYMKSSNPAFENLTRIKITGVFDDFIAATGMACDEDGYPTECDSFEMEFPMDSYLVPELVDRCLRELVGANYRPKDSGNDAMDDLSYIATFIRNNVKKPLQKQIEGAE